jgi:hypothetical protein
MGILTQTIVKLVAIFEHIKILVPLVRFLLDVR